MNDENVDALVLAFFTVVKKMIILNDVLSKIEEQLIIAWNSNS